MSMMDIQKLCKTRLILDTIQLCIRKVLLQITSVCKQIKVHVIEDA